jgi:hypothetical protein
MKDKYGVNPPILRYKRYDEMWLAATRAAENFPTG